MLREIPLTDKSKGDVQSTHVAILIRPNCWPMLVLGNADELEKLRQETILKTGHDIRIYQRTA